MNKVSTTALRLSQALADKHMRASELSQQTGIGKSAISQYLSGKVNPKQDKIYAMAQVLGVNESWLMGLDVPKETASAQTSPLPADAFEYDLSKLHRIPILGRISAGLPIYAEENIEGYTFTDLNGGAEYFALRVIGDSMNAIGICEGYILIVRRQEVVDNGDVAVVLVGDNEATVKRFYQTDTSVTLMPQSTNPMHKPQIYNPQETHISILGKVVKVEFTL